MLPMFPLTPQKETHFDPCCPGDICLEPPGQFRDSGIGNLALKMPIGSEPIERLDLHLPADLALVFPTL